MLKTTQDELTISVAKLTETLRDSLRTIESYSDTDDATNLRRSGVGHAAIAIGRAIRDIDPTFSVTRFVVGLGLKLPL